VKASRPLRAAVVGAGLMGHWHADAIARVGGMVSAIVDPDRRARDSLAARHAGASVAADLAGAIRSVRIDVVHLCTPLETHRTLATEALQAGMHVLVEKPLAPTAAETTELLRLAESRGLLLCPVHQLLFQPGVLRAVAALRTIGPLLHADVTICSAGAECRSPGERDRVVAEILPHPLSLLARTLPEPLSSVDWHVQHPKAGELRATGRAGTITLSVLVSMRGRPTANVIRLTAASGTVHVDLFHGFHVLEAGAVSRQRKIARPFLLAGATLRSGMLNLLIRAARREVAYPGLRALVRHFYRAVRGELVAPIGASETLAVAAARDTLMRSF
jgi:predicted dehydrogenase